MIFHQLVSTPTKQRDEMFLLGILTHQSIQKTSLRELPNETFESDSGQKRRVEIVPETEPSDLVDPSPSVQVDNKIFRFSNEDAVSNNGVVV